MEKTEFEEQWNKIKSERDNVKVTCSHAVVLRNSELSHYVVITDPWQTDTLAHHDVVVADKWEQHGSQLRLYHNGYTVGYLYFEYVIKVE